MKKSKRNQKSLDTFIQQLLNKKNPTTKKQQISLELFNIKQVFFNHKSSTSSILNAMHKLTYISMMGEPINFGIEQISILVSSNQYKHIQIGWLAFVTFDIRDEDAINVILPILQKQLVSYDNECIQCLALSVVSQMFCKEILDVIGPEVAEVAVSPKTSEFARKKALIVIDKIFQITHDPSLVEKLAPALVIYIEHESLAIRMATATLTVGLMSSLAGVFSDVFDSALDQLYQLYNPNPNSEIEKINQDYEGTRSPWYSKQLIRILRFKTNWSFEETSKIDHVAKSLFTRTGEKLPIRPALSYFIVFSEMVSLIPMIQRIPETTIERCITTLSRYLESDRHYMIYFALDSLNHLFHTNPAISKSAINYLPIIDRLIRNDDPQVVTNSLILLKFLSTTENSRQTVEKLIQFLPFSPINIREILCNTISLLCERANDPFFYVDVIVEMLFEVGDKCDESTWQTAISWIDKDQEHQNHAIELTLSYMKKALRPSEQLMKLTIYIAGEFLSDLKIVPEIVKFITRRFALQTSSVQAMMVTAIAKICSRFPNYLNECLNFLEYCFDSKDAEVSDRAQQYYVMIRDLSLYLPILLQRMPPEMTEETLIENLKLLFATSKGETNISTFQPDDDDKNLAINEANEDLLNGFIYFNSGYVFHDFFVRVHLTLNFDVPNIDASLTFENPGVLPLTNLQMQVVSGKDIQSSFSSIPNLINSKSLIANIPIQFTLLNITNFFPKVILNFQCGGNEYKSVITIPLFFSKIVHSSPISPEAFLAKWSTILNKQLFGEIKVPLKIQDENIDQVINELHLSMQNTLGFIPIDLGFKGQIGGYGVYKAKNKSVSFMARFMLLPNHEECSIQIKSSTPIGVSIALSLFMPQDLEENGNSNEYHSFDEEEEDNTNEDENQNPQNIINSMKSEDVSYSYDSKNEEGSQQ